MKYTRLLVVVALTLAVTCACVSGSALNRRADIADMIIDRDVENKCETDDDYNTVCYSCGRQFSNAELFVHCCHINEHPDVGNFCMTLFGKR